MKTTILVVLAILSSAFSFAREYQGQFKKSSNKGDATAANCAPPVSFDELSINNIRTTILTGGDMWWDLVVPRYEVPKDSGKHSLFAGSLWLGGKDASGQLKVAALRFRQVGMDFWTGPLSTVTAEIDPSTCEKWDTHFKSTRTEVDAFVGGTTESIPDFIKEWPAHGDPSKDEATYLAPFIDVDGDGFYSYENGDYPGYDLTGKVDCQGQLINIYGDENLWWIFNDKGNIHTETGGQSIGMEIRAQAFSFATNDEVNNMTFYNYELHNRSSFDLKDTYFGFWVDPDLGNANDDYVGCDVERGLGFCYNGDEFDDDQNGRPGYGENPPAIGVDFFQGPFQDSDGKDNCLCTNYADAIADQGIVYSGSGVGYGDGLIDNERLGMRAFLYFNNNSSVTGDPRVATDYYNYLRSFWRDNTKMVYGGTGHQNSPGVLQPLLEADFMFPDDTDPLGWGTGGDPQAPWTEVTAGNTPFDRRFVQSAGPFALAPGAVNNITVGVVWAKANSGGAAASVKSMKQADTKTQALFDNCFQLLDGPDAPTVNIRELDEQLVFQLSNELGNNKNEDYFEIDPFIVAPDTIVYGDNMQDTIDKATDPVLYDSVSREYRSYRFQGYQVYQLVDASVSAADLYDEDKARLVFQCDVKDNVTRLINYRFDLDLEAVVPELRVDVAANDGVYKTFQVTDDAFATGDRKLVNFRTYYYMAIAYAHNNYKTYNQQEPTALDGQKTPYLPSRKAPTGPIIKYTAIPHKTEMQNEGQSFGSAYGDFVPVTRLEGLGNNGHFLELDTNSVNEIMSGAPYKSANPTYVPGDIAGKTNTPIEIKIIDPLQVKEGDYRIYFLDTIGVGLSESAWYVVGGSLTDSIFSSSRISSQKEELIPELGISITVKDVENAGSDAFTNGLIGSAVVYDDFNKPWLSGVPNADGNIYQNWIRAGKNAEDGEDVYFDYDLGFNNGITGNAIDPDEYYETVIDGTWAPFRLGTWNTHGPATSRQGKNFKNLFQGLPISTENSAYQLGYLNSVDIVFTNDKSKWTRCVVVEMQDDPTLAIGGAAKLDPRGSASVDKQGLSVGDAGYNAAEGDLISPTGMGWFPGYAIDIETGERLNMAFGEDSYLVSEKGNDMIWNPTETMYQGVGSNNIRFGGKHYIYVFRNNDVEESAYLVPTTYNDPRNRMPSYDEGEFMFNKLSTGDLIDYENVYRAAMWVGLPLLEFNQELLSNTATVQIRVNKQFSLFSPGEKISIGATLEKDVEYLVEKGPVSYAGKTYERGQNFFGVDNTTTLNSTPQTALDNVDNVAKTINGGRPTYGFSLTGLESTTNLSDVAKEALDLIRVVPNPYYAYSEYEQDKNDFRVKITNLPGKCKVKIYTLNGILVRELSKDDDSVTSIDWDLKNHARIPVATGMYLIHVEAAGVGEVVLKWYGAMRPVDLDSF